MLKILYLVNIAILPRKKNYYHLSHPDDMITAFMHLYALLIFSSSIDLGSFNIGDFFSRTCKFLSFYKRKCHNLALLSVNNEHFSQRHSKMEHLFCDQKT